MSQLCRNASVAGVVYNGVVLSPNLLQCEEQGAFIDLIQGLRESEEDVYRVFARVSSSTFDWLLELITCIITKQHAVFIWSISSSEHLTRDQKALFLLARSYDALRRNS